VCVPEFGLKCAEEGVILKPAILVVTKSLVVLTEVSTGTISEPIPSLFEQPMLEGYDRVIIYGTQGKRRMLAVLVAKTPFSISHSGLITSPLPAKDDNG
jgi:hypothetical protein